jgi:predicted nucleic acid-binding protein
MADKFFVDTNVLMYAHDRHHGVKRDRARALLNELWASGQGVLSTQVLQELCINLRRRFSPPLPMSEVRDLVRDYMAWEIVSNDPPSALRALEIESRYKISFWDALIVQAAESAGATTLYSEGLSAGQQYCGVKVVNPFTS